MERSVAMKSWISFRRGALTAGALAVAAGCAHVGQDQFDAEMSQLRQEIREGDEGVEQRVMNEVQRLEGELASLAQELTGFREDFNVTVERMEAAVRFNAPVHFAFDDATVQPRDRELLDRFASVVASHYESATITVEGFADPAGNREYNLRLGERRAEAVEAYLVQAGVPSERLRTVSYGDTPDRQMVPDAQGPGEAGWENRRVAMVIDFNPASAEVPRVVADSRDEDEGEGEH